MTDTFAFARRVLIVDAFTCAAAGALMAFVAAPLANLTHLPTTLLLWAGVSLFPVAALFAWMSRTPTLGRGLIWVAVVGNIAWVAASLAALALTTPNAFGYAFVLVQAAAVAALALLETRGLGSPSSPAHQPA